MRNLKPFSVSFSFDATAAKHSPGLRVFALPWKRSEQMMNLSKFPDETAHEAIPLGLKKRVAMSTKMTVIFSSPINIACMEGERPPCLLLRLSEKQR